MIEHDAAKLAERIRADFDRFPDPPHWVWSQCPAAKVIDCVLSLRKKYNSVVLPRVKAFVSKRTDIKTCSDLRKLIDTFQSPETFFADVLSMNSPGKAAMLCGVLDYLLDVQLRFDQGTEDERLVAWAKWARPGDYLAMEVRGFKIAGFQYLRMLFGADTTKPDVHILSYCSEVLGEKIGEARAVYALERAGELLGVPVRSIDVAIWERGAGQSLPS